MQLGGYTAGASKSALAIVSTATQSVASSSQSAFEATPRGAASAASLISQYDNSHVIADVPPLKLEASDSAILAAHASREATAAGRLAAASATYVGEIYALKQGAIERMEDMVR